VEETIEKEYPMSDFESRMKEIDEIVESCDSLETAKAFLHITLMRIDGFEQRQKEEKEFGDKVVSVFDDLLIMFEHHKRKGTSVEELDDIFRTLIAYPRITGQSQLGWYLNC
jgi:CRISPR/Cas system CSM-associated protein Csm2 small subunit